MITLRQPFLAYSSVTFFVGILTIGLKMAPTNTSEIVQNSSL